MASDSSFHVVPLCDVIHHDTSSAGACVCTPSAEPVFRLDGTNGWVITHHAVQTERPYDNPRDGIPLSSPATFWFGALLIVALSLAWMLAAVFS